MIRILAFSLALIAAPAAAQLEYQPLDEPAATARANPPAAGAPTPTAVNTFAEQVDASIVACFYQVLDTEGRATQAELTGRGITFSDVAPEAVRDLANVELLGGARFTQWSVSDGVVWLIAYTQLPACRIMVAETRLAQASRDAIERRVLESGLWVKDEPRSTTAEGIRRQIFFFAADESPNPLVMSITGPVAIERGGDGLQMMISLAAFPPEQQDPTR